MVRSRFICLIRPNRGLAVKYFPFWDNREQKQNFQVNYHSVFRGLKSQREEVYAEVRYNSPQHCTDRVHTGQSSPVPCKCLQHKDDIITSEAKYDGSTADLREPTDSRLSWKVVAMTSPAYVAAKLPVVITYWICFHVTKESGYCATFRGIICFFLEIWLYFWPVFSEIIFLQRCAYIKLVGVVYNYNNDNSDLCSAFQETQGRFTGETDKMYVCLSAASLCYCICYVSVSQTYTRSPVWTFSVSDSCTEWNWTKQISHCHQLINVAHEWMMTGSVYYQSVTGKESQGERLPWYQARLIHNLFTIYAAVLLTLLLNSKI